MAQLSRDARTEIRELAVLLGIADCATDEGAYALGDIEEDECEQYFNSIPTKTATLTNKDGSSYTWSKVIDYDALVNNYGGANETCFIDLELENASISYIDPITGEENEATYGTSYIEISKGQDFNFSVQPDEGYKIEAVSVRYDGWENDIQPSIGIYTIAREDIVENMMISVTTQEGNDDSNYEEAGMTDGYKFVQRLRSYNIVKKEADSSEAPLGSLKCETEWDGSAISTAIKNYNLGVFIASYYGLAPGSVKKLAWYGPQNLKGEEHYNKPPAAIGVKLIGTPQRVFPQAISTIENDGAYTYRKPHMMGATGYNSEDDEPMCNYDEQWETLVENGWFDDDYDILISLKDGSDILGTLGYANFANMFLQLENVEGTDFFEKYALEQYDEWFDTAWNSMIDWLYDNELFFEKAGQTHNYTITLQGRPEQVHLSDGKKEVAVPVNISRVEWQSFSSNAKKAFSFWCTAVGNKQTKYIVNQKRCSYFAAKNFAENDFSGRALGDSLYRLVGWRMPEYLYAKAGREDHKILCSVPTICGMAEHDTKPNVLKEEIIVNDEANFAADGPLSTQCNVPFILECPDYEIEARFELTIRFTDGMFNKPPMVQVKTIGDYPGTYYVLAEE